MQTTLLGLAIAVILALATALIGPLFVDWGSHRDLIDDWLGHVTGLEVQVEGEIHVRILPTPTLMARDIEFGRRGDSNKTRAQELRVELAPGSLISSITGGELRATLFDLRGPQFALKLDPTGRLDWSAPMAGFDPDGVSIENLRIEDGRVTVSHAASGWQLALDNFSFTGQVRSLNGPISGDGEASIALNGQAVPFTYRVAVGHRGDDGAAKVRLSINPGEPRRPGATEVARQSGFDADGSIRIVKDVPQFDGSLQSAGVPGSLDGLSEPWRMSGHLHLDSTKAKLDQIDLQYGADERTAQIRGEANLALGAKPELVAALSAMQIDLDRILGPPAAGRRPQVAIRGLAQSLTRLPQLPFTATLKLNADAVTLAGAVLQRVDAELSSRGAGWLVQRLHLRAPGLTQVAFDGRLSATTEGPEVDGSAQIDSDDPRSLASWLADGSDMRLGPSGPFHLKSKVVLGGDKMAFDQLQMTLDRMKVDGHLDYAWRADGQPARLDATLRAPEIDLDRVRPLLSAALGGQSLDWPWQGMLVIAIGRVVGAGLDAKDISVNLRGDATGFVIEPSSIGDVGGARLTLGGRMDTHGAASGKVDFDLDARSVDGVAALIEKFSAPTADRIRRAAGGSVPVKLHATLEVPRQAQGAANRSALARVTLKGTAGALDLDMQGEADDILLKWTDLAKLATSKVHLRGYIEAGNGGALVDMLGLDGLVAVDHSGRLMVDVSGPLDGELAVKDAELQSRDLSISASGTARFLGGDGPSAQLKLAVAARNVEAFRNMPSARLAELPWTTLNANLAFADNAVKLTDLHGSAAGVAYNGRLDIGMSSPVRLDGDVSVAAVDLASLIGTAIGAPHPSSAGADGAWPEAPFESGLLGRIAGRITVNADELDLTSRLAAGNVGAIVDFEPAAMKVTFIDGGLAGGRLSGQLGFERGDEGMKADGQLVVADANVAALLGGESKSPLSGKLTVDLTLTGAGRSPFALIGSLKGGGKMAWQDGAIMRLDPAVFDTMTRAVDHDLETDAKRIREQVQTAIGAGRLTTAIEATVAVDAGQLRLTDPVVQSSGADVTLAAASLDLVQGVINTRMGVSPGAADGASERRSGVSLSLNGTIDQLKRTLDTSALTNWLSQRHADALERVTQGQGGEAVGSAEPDPAPLPTAIVVPPILVPPSRQPQPSAVAPAPRAPAAPPRQRPAATTPLAPPLDIRPPAAHPPRG